MVTPSVSVSGFRMETNAPDVDHLDKEGLFAGGSAAVPMGHVPVYLGADFVVAGDLDKKVVDNANYYGYSIAVGFGTPGSDVHGGMTYTKTHWSSNIYDMALKFIININKEECDG